MKGERFSQLVGSVQELSGLPAERFVEGQEGNQYPLVLLFLSAGDPRLKGVVKEDEVRRCRDMVAPGGHLVLLTMRMGLDLQPVMGTPTGIDTLVEFAYTVDSGGIRPHTLNPEGTSSMNRVSAATLRQLITRFVPPPPAPVRLWLFDWLKPASDWVKHKLSGDASDRQVSRQEL